MSALSLVSDLIISSTLEGLGTGLAGSGSTFFSTGGASIGLELG